MNILVTGGTGFVGSHLVEHLLDRGYRVRCLVRRNSSLTYLSNSDVEFVYGDIRINKSLEAAMRGVDYVFHLAAVHGGTIAKEEFYEVNVLGTKNLLEVCYRFAPKLRKFIHVSSLSAVGPRKNQRPLTEDSPCFPIGRYGQSKLGGEKIAIEYNNKFPIIIIRPPLVYGPRDRSEYNVLRYMKKVKKGFYLIRGSKKEYFSIIYVKDLVEGLLLAAESNKSEGQKYFLCNEKPTTYEEICTLTGGALQKKYIKIIVPLLILDARMFCKELYARMTNKGQLTKMQGLKKTPQHWICDSSRAKIELGCQPKTSLAEGIEKTALWYSKHGWI